MAKLTVNNQPVEYRMDPQTPLLWALRDASNLTGTKYGCGTGDCGACTVDVDGKPVLACMASIGSLEGTVITTIEGLSRDRSHPLQQAFAAEGVVQCGFCTPGLIIAASLLLRSNPMPDDVAINTAISNLCPCGVYPRIRRAIKRAARVIAGQETIAAVPPPGILPEDAARAVPALTPPPSR